MIKLPNGQSIVKGKVYYRRGNNPTYRKATTPSGFTGRIFHASPRQLHHMIASGDIPKPSLTLP